MTINRRSANALIAELGISESEFCQYTGLRPEMLNSNDAGVDATSIKEILAIFQALEPWFDSPQGRWQWFINQPILSFGQKSASCVILDNPNTGASAVLNYILSKRLGGYE